MNLGSAAAAAPMAGGCAPMASALPANQPPSEVRGQPMSQMASQSPAASTSRLGEQFARALEEQGADEEAAPPREAEPPAGLVPWPPAPPTPSMGMAPPLAPPAGAARASPDAVTAAAKSHEVAAAAPATVAQADAGQVWELSLNEPDGLVLSLRAERVAQPASISGNPPPGWTLAITAPAAEAAALQRHAPRLAERLAARALAPAHLRIAGERESRGE
jgi:hypothetical protein